MGPMKQLALDIGLAPEPTLARFFVGANAALLQHLRLALESGHSGALRAPVPVYLWGEPGCGKTHLLRAVHEALREQGLSVGWMDASTAHLCDFDERWAAVLMDDVDIYTQAQMDLGATVCTRGRPACGRCPVAERCVALRELPEVGEGCIGCGIYEQRSRPCRDFPFASYGCHDTRAQFGLPPLEEAEVQHWQEAA